MPSPSALNAPHVVVDWGTTSFRAVLLAADGTQRDRIETGDGIQFVEKHAFETRLLALLAPWLEAEGALDIVLVGMVTSRNGWIEVPYVPCPCSLEDLARGTVTRTLSNGSRAILLAGINDPARAPFPDVMRGEETQIVGFGLEKDATLVLPGTHSKWARVAGGRISGFRTFVTGEFFALLTQHSFIARAAGSEHAGEDMAAFERGIEDGSPEGAEGDAMLSLVFAARTGMLAGKLAPGEIRDYVSGLLIAQEFRQARNCGFFASGERIGIVGNDGLNRRYAVVARHFGLDVVEGSDHAAIDGARQILAAAMGDLT
ncbi:2-dehydro-3-deoxygalactonokinase [Stappia sp. WLB 29]|uniref:2-dehydro-3-deoxygalactonokinase n=1 Tax=Stappia sp. WLB 29 TaxID=2925220 RepID=UPI0020BF66EF|nr:2-dehydro-3-deoxygalactonokinase [Stappia sp. WLB 29]